MGRGCERPSQKSSSPQPSSQRKPLKTNAKKIAHSCRLFRRLPSAGRPRYSSSAFTIMFARNSSRGRNGNMSSSGFDTIDPSAF
jgi:hypothetical protein